MNTVLTRFRQHFNTPEPVLQYIRFWKKKSPIYSMTSLFPCHHLPNTAPWLHWEFQQNFYFRTFIFESYAESIPEKEKNMYISIFGWTPTVILPLWGQGHGGPKGRGTLQEGLGRIRTAVQLMTQRTRYNRLSVMRNRPQKKGRLNFMMLVSSLNPKSVPAAFILQL